jgi:dynein heavy chain
MLACACYHRSLFEKDKLLFAFLLCARVMLGKKEMDGSLYQFLLTGKRSLPSAGNGSK